MSTNIKPLAIQLHQIRTHQELDRILENNPFATTAVVELKSDAMFGTVALEGCPLLRDKNDIIRSVGQVGRKLSSLSRLVLDFSCVVQRSSQNCHFPVEALTHFFRARSDTLVSLKTFGPKATILNCERASAMVMLGQLGKVQSLDELDLRWLRWVAVPERLGRIGGILLNAGRFGVQRHQIDPDHPTLDPNLIIDTINALPKLRKLALCFQGCGMEEKCSIVKRLVEGDNRLNSLKLVFKSLREVAKCEDRLNSILESALETNMELEDLALEEDPGDNITLSTIALFWLKMNKIGRKRLLQDPMNHSRWLETLLKHKDDIRLSFFLLSSNVEAFFGSVSLDGNSIGSACLIKIKNIGTSG
jgi:hypothetical protein